MYIHYIRLLVCISIFSWLNTPNQRDHLYKWPLIIHRSFLLLSLSFSLFFFLLLLSLPPHLLTLLYIPLSDFNCKGHLGSFMMSLALKNNYKLFLWLQKMYNSPICFNPGRNPDTCASDRTGVLLPVFLYHVHWWDERGRSSRDHHEGGQTKGNGTTHRLCILG